MNSEPKPVAPATKKPEQPLRPAEAIGVHLLSLDVGLPLETLVGPIRDALSEGSSGEYTTEAVNRRGQGIACRVRTLPLTVTGSDASDVIVLIEQLPDAPG